MNITTDKLVENTTQIVDSDFQDIPVKKPSSLMVQATNVAISRKIARF